MSIATCGHKVEEGISCTVDEYQIDSMSGSPLLSYGTYCWECLKNKKIKDIHNSELKKALTELNLLKKELKKLKK